MQENLCLGSRVGGCGGAAPQVSGAETCEMKITLLDKCGWKGGMQLSLDPRGLQEIESNEWRRVLRSEKRKVSPSYPEEQSGKCQIRYVSTGFSNPKGLFHGESFQVLSGCGNPRVRERKWGWEGVRAAVAKLTTGKKEAHDPHQNREGPGRTASGSSEPSTRPGSRGGAREMSEMPTASEPGHCEIPPQKSEKSTCWSHDQI